MLVVTADVLLQILMHGEGEMVRWGARAVNDCVVSEGQVSREMGSKLTRKPASLVEAQSSRWKVRLLLA